MNRVDCVVHRCFRYVSWNKDRKNSLLLLLLLYNIIFFLTVQYNHIHTGVQISYRRNNLIIPHHRAIFVIKLTYACKIDKSCQAI